MKKDIIKILKKVGAVTVNDHLVLTSGRHGDVYINKDTLYLHTKETSEVGKMFAEKFKNKKIDIVVAPAVGGTILSQWTAFHLSKLKKQEILAAYSEKDKGTNSSAAESEQIFKRGYGEYVKNKNVLVLEDLTTTGISVKKVVEAVRSIGGHVVAVCVMVNRDPDKVNEKSIGAPFSSLGVFKASSWEESDCPMCQKNVPINTVLGHGKKYLEEKEKNNL
jgi:orotate phosphoribosyltransferase